MYHSVRNNCTDPKPLSELQAVQRKLERLLEQVNDATRAIGNRVESGSRAQLVRAIARARRRRSELFAPELFADPAWEMLLELYINELEQTRISVTSLCIASGVPATTALRWISRLCVKGLASRRKDPHDARRAWIELTEQGRDLMMRYFDEFAVGLPLL